jgi:HAD superfamily hydrolase (TIGR01509 family)
MSFQYIFWDNDGVLVETEPLYLQASREALAKADIALSEEQFSRISLTDGRSIFDLAVDRGLPAEDILGLKRWRNARYAELLETEDVALGGVRDVLERLHGKIMMAIVTSSLRSHFDIIHRRTGLLPFFDFCLTREDYAQSKPSAEPYLLALQKSGCQAGEALVIEDSPRGLQAAKAAGLTCWVLPGKHTSREGFSRADRVLHSLDEVPGLLF